MGGVFLGIANLSASVIPVAAPVAFRDLLDQSQPAEIPGDARGGSGVTNSVPAPGIPVLVGMKGVYDQEQNGVEDAVRKDMSPPSVAANRRSAGNRSAP